MYIQKNLDWENWLTFFVDLSELPILRFSETFYHHLNYKHSAINLSLILVYFIFIPIHPYERFQVKIWI